MCCQQGGRPLQLLVRSTLLQSGVLQAAHERYSLAALDCRRRQTSEMMAAFWCSEAPCLKTALQHSYDVCCMMQNEHK